MISLIISGGQTGADLAGLRAAKSLDIETGGYAPAGYMTENGPALFLGSMYGLEEMDTTDYKARTEKNVKLADATVIFGRRSPGSNKTEWYCQQHNKPFLWLTPPLYHKDRLLFRVFLNTHNPETLNIAGNRESTFPGVGNMVYEFLLEALK